MPYMDPAPARSTANPSEARPWLWALPFAVLVVAVVAVPLLLLSEAGLPRYRALREELAGLRERNAQLRDEVLLLKERVERLRSDPTEIERIARDELGYVKADEVVLDF